MERERFEMQFYAAELRKELDRTAVEGCYCEVETFDDGTGTVKIKVKSSAVNFEQTTLYCLNDVIEYCNANELKQYVTVETLLSGTVIPIIVIF